MNMKFCINDRWFELPEGRYTLAQVLEDQKLPLDHLAVAVNGEIIKKDTWHQFIIRPEDHIEVVHAMAGGASQAAPAEDVLVIAGRSFSSRLFVGTGKYDTPQTMQQALEASGTELVTVSVRYMNLDGRGTDSIMPFLDLKRYALLPNTAGATTAEQAVRMAHLAREATGTNWIKLEVIGEPETLWPDVVDTIEATKRLVKDGFVVLPYTSTDLVTALRLEDAGAATVMPLASPIGSGQGFIDWRSIARIIERVQVPVVVDAGIGVPSDAAMAMEMGADAVLVNTAIARAGNPVWMARAMRMAVESGRLAKRAGRMPIKPIAQASSPTEGVIREKPGA